MEAASVDSQNLRAKHELRGHPLLELKKRTTARTVVLLFFFRRKFARGVGTRTQKIENFTERKKFDDEKI